MSLSRTLKDALPTAFHRLSVKCVLTREAALVPWSDVASCTDLKRLGGGHSPDVVRVCPKCETGGA